MYLDIKAYAGEVLEKIKEDWRALALADSYFFAIVSASEDPASQIYMKHKKTDAEKCGIPYQAFHCETKESLELTIQNLNFNKYCLGIMLQLPLSPELSEETDKMIALISPSKDVDGLTWENQSNIALGEEAEFYPCTALGVMDLLDFLSVDFTKSPVAVIGRSKLVGKPLLGMLQARNATTIACHSKTQNLQEITKACGIVISATGRAGLITKEHLSEGAIGVDVGIHRLDDGRIVGDMATGIGEGNCTVTPVPGGVGLLTRASLMKNVLIAGERVKD